MVHQQVTSESQPVCRSPTFSNCDNHLAAVVAIKPLPESGDHLEKMSAFPIVSLDSSGILVVWTVLDSQRDHEKNLGLAHWGQVRMVSTTRIDLSHTMHSELGPSHEIRAHDIGVDPGDSSHLLAAAGDGLVIHGSTQPDHRPSPRLYRPEIETLSACRSVAACPFDESYFLIGSDDGSIRLHSMMNERPLITWSGTVDNEPIMRVVWSPSRPCVFFILDTANRYTMTKTLDYVYSTKFLKRFMTAFI